MERAKVARVPVRGYVSCVLGCPYDGLVAPGAVVEVSTIARRYLQDCCYSQERQSMEEYRDISIVKLVSYGSASMNPTVFFVSCDCLAEAGGGFPVANGVLLGVARGYNGTRNGRHYPCSHGDLEGSWGASGESCDALP